MQLSLGPVLYNWAPERWRDFYFRIADDLRQVVGHRDFENLTPLLQQARHQLASVAHHVLQRDVLRTDAELPGFDADALEQVVDQPRESMRAALQRPDQLVELLARHVLQVILQQLERRQLRRGLRRAPWFSLSGCRDRARVHGSNAITSPRSRVTCCARFCSTIPRSSAFRT